MSVSVCIATHNGSEFIKDQIDSILCQLSDDDEIIISDDESTDKTRQIIQSYQDARIKLFNHKTSASYRNKPVNYRITKNFENALKNATGDIIFLADQDDMWEKTKVQEILKLFQEEKVNLVLHDAVVVNKELQVQFNSYFQITHSRPGLLKNIIKNSYLGCCMAFDREILNKSLPFPDELIAHDMWIGLLAERYGRVLFLNKQLISYRRHSSTATTSGNNSGHSILFKISYRVQFLFQYLLRIIFKSY
jgi:glycosyltransferase involved in cell wall biosynthesis